jgi:hypothetical protein
MSFSGTVLKNGICSRTPRPIAFMPSAGKRPDEKAAAAMERYACRGDAGGQGDAENQLQWVPVPTRDRGGYAGCGACITDLK